MIAPEDEAEAWFDKEHSLALGKRATALGMSYPAADVRLPTAGELSAARGFFSDKGFAVISD